MSFECEPEHYRSLMERYGLPEDVIDGVLGMHAHELAEQQRAAEAEWRLSGYEGARRKGWLIDLIDPEVSS
ncbi:hypothetical protein ACFUJU_07845 [Streptomyces sp. NPDC057235]|uniref:hypothetical protein n=1 Tax=Streptomyces sp. NPDC057235 TaxID=3346058 RepID=UPI00364279E8